MGRLLRDLHGLKSNDPNAFAKVTASIATRLHEIAATEPEEVADRLDKLAERFSQASQTGNLTSFRPSEQTSFRALRGPAAYAQQQLQEDRQEIRTEVRSAIDQVLSEYLVDAEPELDGTAGADIQTEAETPTTRSLTVSA
jgi:DNA-binding ferritin-like protein